MSFIVVGTCVGCKHADCVEVCPVDCFHDAGDMLLIDPIECIDCGACVPVCPEKAIFGEDNVPAIFHEFIEINKEATNYPVIDEKPE